MSSQTLAVFRTKADILTARDLNNFKIEDSVLNNPAFANAKMTDMFGFKLVEGSDWRVIDCKLIGDDPTAFFNFAFGEKIEGESGEAGNK